MLDDLAHRCLVAPDLQRALHAGVLRRAWLEAVSRSEVAEALAGIAGVLVQLAVRGQSAKLARRALAAEQTGGHEFFLRRPVAHGILEKEVHAHALPGPLRIIPDGIGRGE